MHMTRKKTQHFRIAIIQDFALKAAKEITRGVLRYANGNPEWNIRLLGTHMSNNDFLYPEDWKMDGAICGLGTDFPDITSLIREHKPGESSIRASTPIIRSTILRLPFLSETIRRLARPRHRYSCGTSSAISPTSDLAVMSSGASIADGSSSQC